MTMGHNSGQFYGGLSAEHLRQFIDRLERLEEEKRSIAEDIKAVLFEAKSTGFDVKTIRQILKLRKIEPNEREEQEYLLETYSRALGMLPTDDESEDDIEEKLEAARRKATPVAKKIISYINLLEAAEESELSIKDTDFIQSLRAEYRKFGDAAIISDDQIKWLEDIGGRA